MEKQIYNYLNSVVDNKGAGYLILIDPDTRRPSELKNFVNKINQYEVDGILIGGSLLMDSEFDQTVEIVKSESEIPVILFPGSAQQLSAKADAILYMSLLSGRNSRYLIEEQVTSAPFIKKNNIEAISTGYILFNCGKTTTVEFVSNTRPLPPHKPEIAVSHALAAQYMGMDLIYLEAGSGADRHIPQEVIQQVNKFIDIPIITGGGIRQPSQAQEIIQSGSDFIVTGNIFDDDSNSKLIDEFINSIHYKN